MMVLIVPSSSWWSDFHNQIFKSKKKKHSAVILALPFLFRWSNFKHLTKFYLFVAWGRLKRKLYEIFLFLFYFPRNTYEFPKSSKVLNDNESHLKSFHSLYHKNEWSRAAIRIKRFENLRVWINLDHPSPSTASAKFKNYFGLRMVPTAMSHRY